MKVKEMKMEHTSLTVIIPRTLDHIIILSPHPVPLNPIALTLSPSPDAVSIDHYLWHQKLGLDLGLHHDKHQNIFAGSPKYFGPILHYLRTNTIDIPSGYKLSAMRMEAEYYGIQKIVDHIDFLESEKKQEDSQPKGEKWIGYCVLVAAMWCNMP